MRASIRLREITKEAKYDNIFKTYSYTFFYNLLIDPQYSTGYSGYYVGDQFIAEDTFLSFKLSFDYFEGKLYKIILDIEVNM